MMLAISAVLFLIVAARFARMFFAPRSDRERRDSSVFMVAVMISAALTSAVSGSHFPGVFLGIQAVASIALLAWDHHVRRMSGSV